MTSRLKIGYFADGIWSHKALSLFLGDKDLEVAFICARFKCPDIYLKKEAQKYGIDFFSCENVNDKLFKEKLSNYKCNLFVSMSFNQIFDKELINIPPLGTINCHASKLPFYKGRNILNWVLINDEKEFGITVHYVDTGIDTGDIILQKTYTISDHDNYKTLLELSFKECPLVLYESVQLIKRNKVERIPQSSILEEGFYCKRRKEGDEFINWDLNTRQLFNFIRALTTPGPCANAYLRNNLIKIIDSQIERSEDFGSVKVAHIAQVGKNYFVVKTIDGYLKITNWNCLTNPKVGDKLV